MTDHGPDPHNQDGKLFRLLVENLKDYAIFVLDPQGRVQSWNSGAERLLGYTEDEIIGESSARFFTPDDIVAGIPQQELDEALRTGRGNDDRWQVRKGGSWFFASGVTTPLRDENGRLHGFAKMMRDRTEWKQAMEALRASEERFRGLMEQAPFSVQVFDATGHTLRVNRAWEELWGIHLNQIADYNVLNDPQLESKGILPHLRRAFAGEPVRIPATPYDPNETVPGLTRHADPVRWVAAVAYPIKDATGQVREVILIHEDVTERKRAEDALREADHRKDEFMALLAHELRNPLAPIRNAVQILGLKGDDPAVLERARAMIDRQTIQMTRLVDDLLDASRIARGKIRLAVEPVDLAALVRTTVGDYRHQAEAAGLSVEVAVPPDPVWVRGDVARLTQVLTNLLANAVKFTPRGGRVSARVDVQGHEAVLSVTDTGIGIAPADLPKLFEPFHQVNTDPARMKGGLGLGLAVVKGLAELHGGRVKATSAGASQGATFAVRLPLDVKGQTVRSSTPHASPMGQQRRVVIVEDNADTAESLRELLEMKGFTVSVAVSGTEGVELCRRERPDAVVCDLGLPGMSGFDVARALRNDPATAGATLVAVSGYAQEEDRQQAREAGFDTLLAKPADTEELARLLTLPPARRAPL